jgi:hypothetical protein
MMRQSVFLAGVLAIVVSVRPSLAGDDATRTWSFDGDEVGTIAKGFSSEVGEWKVVNTSEGKALAQTARSPDSTFNVALVSDTDAKDVDLSVRMKAVAGENDQGGGLVWRAKDAKNYYIARYNPLEDNFRVYKVVNGQRTLFKGVTIPHSEGWHTLRVTMAGDHMECYYDGKKWLDVTDSTFPGAGRIGLWSKADAQSQFDDLTLRRP